MSATETSLQSHFDTQGEGIDAHVEASSNPGVFSPLCNFTATLVLSESQAAAGLAWYNVPASPTAAPDAIYPILPESANATGAVVHATDIRSSPDYAGGHIGFALTKFGGTAIYYSEYQRNANCTACTIPGHWKMMLSYRSKLHQSSYYIAFEDWEGANQETWFGNDGDFNDKVFLVTGVSCPGGGEPCETGKPGLCSAGLTECSTMGAPQCKQQYTERTETCDNVDNDCDGLVDDGEQLCPSDEVCFRGKCVSRCSTGEFRCPPPLTCDEGGVCVDAACRGVVCGAGLVCRDGRCVGECQGVVCPLGQVCQLDRCVDPCASVTCPAGTFCDRGVCVGDCTCSGCPAGKACASNGSCVVSGCENVSCSAGQGCRDGACVDACDGAVCPGSAACMNGVCAAPIAPTDGGRAGNGSGGGVVVINPGEPSAPGVGGGNAGQGGAAGQETNSSAGAGSNGLPAGGPERAPSSPGCGCRVAPKEARGTELLGAGALALLAGLARPRRRRA